MILDKLAMLTTFRTCTLLFELSIVIVRIVRLLSSLDQVWKKSKKNLFHKGFQRMAYGPLLNPHTDFSGKMHEKFDNLCGVWALSLSGIIKIYKA